MFDLNGRNYIVTGGAQGIGFAVTRAIAEMGGNVAVIDVQDAPVAEFYTLSAKFDRQLLYIKADVRDQASLNEAFAKIEDTFKSIDGLVPAAGIAIDKPFIEQSWEEFTKINEINVSAKDLYTFWSLNLFSAPSFRLLVSVVKGRWLTHCVRYEEHFSSVSCLQSTFSRETDLGVWSSLPHSPLILRYRDTEWQHITPPRALC
jgi:NAD(P)-dependent dehydrogenase (short-subunit alcohol dehydrogenase family)